MRIRNIENLAGKRPDREKEKLGLEVDFSSSLQLFSVEFLAVPASVPVSLAVNFLTVFFSSFRTEKEENPR